MKRIILASLGSFGDVFPYVALGMALKNKGFDPLLLVNPIHVPTCTQYDLEAVSVGEALDVDTFLNSNKKYTAGTQAGPAVFKDLFIPYAYHYFEETVAQIEKSSIAAVVAHNFCLGAIWAAKKKRIPIIVPHLAPVSLMSNDSFSHMPFIQRSMMRMIMPFGMRMFSKMVQPMCKELDVSWSKNIIQETMTQPDLLLGMWSQHFAPLKSFNNPHRVICGFPYLDISNQELSTELQSFLSNNNQPILFTLGGSSDYVAGNFYKQAVKTCEVLGVRGLFVGNNAHIKELPDFIFATSYAPYEKILSQCQAIVHHAGIGTTALAIKTGKPAVAVPFMADQIDNALRAKQLGVAHVVSKKEISTKLTSAVEHALKSSMKKTVQTLASKVAQEKDGAQQAASLISQLVINH